MGEDLPESSLPFLSEVVTESGDPVPGALVLLGDLDAPSWSGTADGDGRFVLDAFPMYDTLRARARRARAGGVGAPPPPRRPRPGVPPPQPGHVAPGGAAAPRPP